MKINKILNELTEEIEELQKEREEALLKVEAFEIVLDRWGHYDCLDYKERKTCIELEVIHRKKTGLTYVEIAEKYDVSRETILKRRRRLIFENRL